MWHVTSISSRLLILLAMVTACGNPPSPVVEAPIEAPATTQPPSKTAAVSPVAPPTVRPTPTPPSARPTTFPTPAASQVWTERLIHPAGVQIRLPTDWRPQSTLLEFGGANGWLKLRLYAFPGQSLADLCTTSGAGAAQWLSGFQGEAKLAEAAGRPVCLLATTPGAPANRALLAYPAPRVLQTGVLIEPGAYTHLWIWVEPPELFESVLAGIEFPAQPSAAAGIRGFRDIFDFSYIFVDQIDTAAWETEALAAVSPEDTLAAAYSQVERLFARIADQVGDRHGRVIPAERIAPSTGQVRTVGVYFDQAYVVFLVIPGGPGALAGFQVGDRLIRVNGLPVTEPQAFANAPYTVEFEREGQLLTLSMAPTPLDPFVPPLSRRLTDRIAYLETFGYNTFSAEGMRKYAQAVHDAIAAYDEPETCWIVDLRRNLGGSKHAILGGIGPLAGNGPLYYSRDRTRLDQANFYQDGQVTGATLTRFSMKPLRPYLRASPEARLALLVSTETASGGELSAMILSSQPEVRARIFGEQTVGLTTDVGISELYDYGRLHMPVTVWVDLDGQTYPRGIVPEAPLPVVYDARYGSDEDPLLQAARAWLETEQGCLP